MLYQIILTRLAIRFPMRIFLRENCGTIRPG